LELVKVADVWLEQMGPAVYPRPDGKNYQRRGSALSDLADPDAIVSGLRRRVFARDPVLGSVSLCDWEAAAVAAPKVPGSQSLSRKAELDHIIAKMDPAGRDELSRLLNEGIAALQHIEARMAKDGGLESCPDFGSLTRVLNLARSALPSPGGSDKSTVGASPSVGDDMEGAVAGINRISSRADADRALAAVAEFLRGAEPTNPVPLLLDRARALLQKRDFLEVLADVAPDAVAAVTKVLRGPDKKS
jgi:type VI secretion system protein ImpA